VGDVPITEFQISRGHTGATAKEVVATTDEQASAVALKRAAAHGRIYPRVKLEAFKHHTRTVVLSLTLRQVGVTGVQTVEPGKQLRFTLEAESFES